MSDRIDNSGGQLRIPPAWKTHWDQISQGRMSYLEQGFESLLCLTLPPDFVLDFGWCLRDNVMHYDLQINRSHFGEGDVVYHGCWGYVDPALLALQEWLDRLVAEKADEARDLDLQARLAKIEKRLRHVFIPPAGEQLAEPFSHYVRRLILKEPARYWEAGSGDAALHFRNRHGVVVSQLIFVLREPHGVHIEYHAPDGPVLCCVKGRKARGVPPTIEIALGGAPWDIPANQFVSRRAAARILGAFIDEGTGQRPNIGNWV